MANTTPPPPPGFTLDKKAEGAPPPPPGFTLNEAPVAKPRLSENTLAILDHNAFGRVLSAFSEGAKEGFGSEKVGLSDASTQYLRDVGLFEQAKTGYIEPFKAFNEALLRPVIAVGDAAFRGINALVDGGVEVVGQLAKEMGASDSAAESLKNEAYNFTNFMAVSAGVSPAPAMLKGASEIRAAERKAVASRAKEIERPVPTKPTQLYQDEGFEQVAPRPDPARPPVPDAVEVAPPPAKTLAAENVNPSASISPPDGPSGPLVDKAGNINLNYIGAPEDVKDVIRQMADANDGFKGATRSPMTFEQTQELADSIGMTAQELTLRKKGQAFNAEEAVAARNLLVQSSNNVFEMGRAIRGGKNTDADIRAFQEAMTRHQAIQEQVAGMTAEAGRALNSFKIVAGEKQQADALKAVIDAAGGRASAEELAGMIGQLNSPQQVSKFLMDARKAKTSDMVVEAWINGLLSGPQTHATNVLSNTLVTLWAVPENALAGAIGAGRRKLGVGPAETVFAREANGRFFGIVQGAREGIIAAARAFKTETPTGGLSKLEQRKYQSIPSKTFKEGQPKKTFSVGGKDIPIPLTGETTWGGKTVRVPGRLLLASDEIFKAIGYRQELNAQAYRVASAEGKKGKAFAARVAEIVANPTDDMLDAARKNADYQTFTKELGKMGRSAQEFTNSHPAVKVIVPFMRTPTNILKFAGERTALSPLSTEVRAALRGDFGGAAMDQQIARITMGTGVGIAVATLAAEGLITGGGPLDPKQRAVMYANGWQPYSLKIGDMYYSYGRLEPLGTLFGVAADMYEISDYISQDDADNVALLITASVAKNLTSKTWLQGPADAMQALTDPDRYGANYLNKLAGTLVPTGVAQVARVNDPYLREARGFVDTWKSRTPGLTKSLYPRRDIWGDAIELGGSLGPDLGSPIYESRINSDPASKALLELKIWPAKPSREIRGVEMTSEQYDVYQQYNGRQFKMAVDNLVSIDGWQQMPAFIRTEMIENAQRSAKEMAQSAVMAQFPDIYEKMLKAKQDEIKALK